MVDPDSGDTLLGIQLKREERTAARRRDFTIGSPQGGLVQGRFLLPAVDAAVVVTALRPLAAPRPAGASGGADPWQDPVAAAAPTARDDRTHGQRMADAFVELCDRALIAGDLPERGGERPQLVVTVDLDRLRARTGAGELLDGTPVAPAVLRRIAREGGVIPAVLVSTGQPLDITGHRAATRPKHRHFVAAPTNPGQPDQYRTIPTDGRETRTVPTGIRRALVLRDRGCAFPGRDRPASWCDAHHLRHWADGGPTSLGNLARCRADPRWATDRLPLVRHLSRSVLWSRAWAHGRASHLCEDLPGSTPGRQG